MPSIDGLSAEVNGPLQDYAIHELWLRIDDVFGFRPRLDYFTTVVTNVCRRNSYHPVKDYFGSLSWDGESRIDTWLIDYCNAADTPFNRAVGRIWLLAAVRRIMRPGEKFDTMLILEGPEGNNKSGVFRVLAVLDAWFSDSIRFTDDDKQIMEKASGKWIIEIADLHGMTRAGYDKIKAQLSRQSDRARLAYARLASEVLRQFVTGGTTNVYEYLASLTGNRRIWCVRTLDWIDLNPLRAVRDQLWAEAVVLEASEPDLFLPRELWEAARIVQAEREVENAFIDKLNELIGDEDGWVFAHQIWEALDIPVVRVGDKEQQQLGHAMKALGFKRKRMTSNKARVTYYERASTEGERKHFRFEFNSARKKWMLSSRSEPTDEELDEYNGPFVDSDIDDLE
jgi:predicted P-loop ATPase